MKTNTTKRSIWKSILVFALVLSFFYLADLTAKLFIFDPHHLYGTETQKITNWTVIGFRSVPHDNSTLFSALGVKLPLYAHFVINFTLAFLFSLPVLFARSYTVSIGTGILVAGILGNTIDKIATRGDVVYNGRVFSHYVMDILYLPWYDRGTFNLADVWIVVGAGLLLLFFIIGLIRDLASRNETQKVNVGQTTKPVAEPSLIKTTTPVKTTKPVKVVRDARGSKPIKINKPTKSTKSVKVVKGPRKVEGPAKQTKKTSSPK